MSVSVSEFVCVCVTFSRTLGVDDMVILLAQATRMMRQATEVVGRFSAQESHNYIRTHTHTLTHTHTHTCVATREQI